MEIDMTTLHDNDIQDQIFQNLKKIDQEIKKPKPILKSKTFDSKSKHKNITPNRLVFKQEIKSTKCYFKKASLCESSEPSVIDPTTNEEQNSNMVICPAHKLVGIKDCMKIKTLEKDECLQIQEEFQLSIPFISLISVLIILLTMWNIQCLNQYTHQPENILLFVNMIASSFLIVLVVIQGFQQYKINQPNPHTNFLFMLNHNNGVELVIQVKQISDEGKFESKFKVINDVSFCSVMKLNEDIFDTDVLLGRKQMRKKSKNILNENDIIKQNLSKKLSFIAKKLDNNNKSNELEIFSEKIQTDSEYLVLENYQFEYFSICEQRKTLKDEVFNQIKQFVQKWKSLKQIQKEHQNIIMNAKKKYSGQVDII